MRINIHIFNEFGELESTFTTIYNWQKLKVSLVDGLKDIEKRIKEIQQLKVTDINKVMNMLPKLLDSDDLRIDGTDSSSVMISKTVERDVADKLFKIIFLSYMYVSAYEAGAQDELDKFIPEANPEHISKLFTRIKSHKNFPIIFYRITRINGILADQINLRQLNLVDDLLEKPAAFFEISFKLQNDSGEEIIRMELDEFELKSLIRKLSESIG